MFITKIILPKADDYTIHQLIWCYFKEHQEKGLKRPFCYSLNDGVATVLSESKITANSNECVINNGDSYLFECKASIRRTYKDEAGKTKVRASYTGAELKEWFKRRFEFAAKIDFITYNELPFCYIDNPKKKNRMIFKQRLFIGKLTIIDERLFKEIALKGIGHGCGFGFGAIILSGD